jgi:hypothetical protein
MIQIFKKAIILIILLVILTSVLARAQEPIKLQPNPTLPFQPTGPTGHTPTTETGQQGFSYFAQRILKFAIVAGALLAVILIIVAGIIYIMAGGNVGKTAMAKDMIQNALLGLLIIAGSYLILYTINPDLVRMDLGITELIIHKKEKAPEATIVPLNNCVDIVEQMEEEGEPTGCPEGYVETDRSECGGCPVTSICCKYTGLEGGKSGGGGAGGSF